MELIHTVSIVNWIFRFLFFIRKFFFFFSPQIFNYWRSILNLFKTSIQTTYSKDFAYIVAIFIMRKTPPKIIRFFKNHSRD